MRNLLVLALLLALAVATLAAPVPQARKRKWPSEIASSEIVGVYQFGSDEPPTEIVLSSDGSYYCYYRQSSQWVGVWELCRGDPNSGDIEGAQYLIIRERQIEQPDAPLNVGLRIRLTRGEKGVVKMYCGWRMVKRQVQPPMRQLNGRAVEPEGKR